jgi:hypothetical protein
MLINGIAGRDCGSLSFMSNQTWNASEGSPDLMPRQRHLPVGRPFKAGSETAQSTRCRVATIAKFQSSLRDWRPTSGYLGCRP